VILREVLGQWRVEPLALVPLAATAAVYLAAARRARRWPAWRSASFTGGLVLLAAAQASGLHRTGEELLSVHMVEHLLLITVVPALLVLGAPVSLALRSLSGTPRRELARVVRSRAAAALTRPGPALVVFCAVLLATHAPPFYDAALRSPALHALEHALYLWAALLLWSAALASEPLPRAASALGRMLVLLLAMPPMALLGVVVASADHPLYSAYAASAGRFGTTALADQQAAGHVMWIGGTLALAATLLPAAWHGLQAEERRARLREAYADRHPRAGGPS
jgi:putative membrane protein